MRIVVPVSVVRAVRIVRFGAIAVRISDDPAADIARSLAVRLRAAISRRGHASLAVSGGSTAPPMLAAFVRQDIRWDRLTIWQVDERIVPDGDPDRNARELRDIPARTVLMPVTVDDLAHGAIRYGEGLPERFDAVHLGLGDDGHTASWPPDPHPDATVVRNGAPVALVGDFNGRDRMTLTPGPINGARSRLLLTTGLEKADIVRRWIGRDASIPAGFVRRSATTVFLDRDAASALQR